MNATLFQEFRAMQLAVKGASGKASSNWSALILEGIDSIPIGDNAEINEVCLNKDYVNVSVCDVNSLIPINILADEVLEEIICAMRAKALEIANCDVMVNGYGELAPNQIRG